MNDELTVEEDVCCLLVVKAGIYKVIVAGAIEKVHLQSVTVENQLQAAPVLVNN